jgi:hypothetical protein
MKKTLLLTTALIGSLLIGSVQAQTTITGELKMAYKTTEGFTTGAPSNSGFTSERQINIASKGKLNNGLDYAAGFSLEQDGNEDGKGTHTTGTNASLNSGIDGKEGNYFNIISGNTTVTLGMDHILNGDYAIVPRAGAPMNEEIGNLGGTPVRTDSRAGLQYNQSLGDNNEFMGLGVIQTIPSVGRLAVNFVPRVDDNAQTADTVIPTSATGKSAYSLFFVGDLGVKGLQVALERAQNEKNSTDLTDQKVTALGASYTMGDFSFGAERQKFVDATKAETETTEYGLTYKINNNASAGIGMIKTEGQTAAGAGLANDEEIKYLQIGYNLGGFSTQLSVIDAENVAFDSTKDAKSYVFKIATKF